MGKLPLDLRSNRGWDLQIPEGVMVPERCLPLNQGDVFFDLVLGLRKQVGTFESKPQRSSGRSCLEKEKLNPFLS